MKYSGMEPCSDWAAAASKRYTGWTAGRG